MFADMQRTEAHGREPELATLPELSRRYGIGLHALRRAAKRGDFPIYMCGTSWPRVALTDFERWVRSTRPEPGESDA
jgi:hypothetical protein